MKKVLILFLLLLPVVFAHQPRLVDDAQTVIIDPEISKAFYSELVGSPHVYTISSDVPFALYVNVLLPDVEGVDKDVVVRVFKDKVLFFTLDSDLWVPYYEEHGGDDYFMGSEFRDVADPGLYEIEVSSPDNFGKYVLVVGEVEAFPFSEIVKTVWVMPELKMFFGKNPLLAYTTPTMLGFLGSILVVIGLVTVGIVVGYRKFRKK